MVNEGTFKPDPHTVYRVLQSEIDEVERLILNLADQQAYPDESWKATWEDLRKRLTSTEELQY